jgi:hypothetical protein
MTPERQAEFLVVISEGESIAGACRRLKISNGRVNTFRNAHRDFDAQVRQAFADSALKRQEIFRQRSTAWRPRSGVPSRPVEGKKVPAIVEPFLAELAHGASVTAAAEYAGVSRAMVFRWRRDDLEFARRWDEAVQMGVDRLEDEAYRRAVHGVARPVYQGGARVGEVREYSDTLLLAILRGKRPEIYARPETQTSLNVEFRLTREQALERLRQLGLPVPFIETEFERDGETIAGTDTTNGRGPR